MTDIPNKTAAVLVGLALLVSIVGLFSQSDQSLITGLGALNISSGLSLTIGTFTTLILLVINLVLLIILLKKKEN